VGRDAARHHAHQRLERRGQVALERETLGGTNDVTNLAVACSRCNRQKGSRHDHTPSAKLDQVVATLRTRRMDRWRDPEETGQATRLAAVLTNRSATDSTS